MTRKIKKVGNFSPTGHYGKNVYDSNGICPTLCSGSLVKNGLNILIGGGTCLIEKLKELVLLMVINQVIYITQVV